MEQQGPLLHVRKAALDIGFLKFLFVHRMYLGGRGMEILANEQQLEAYLEEAYLAPDKHSLIDEYLGHKTEIDVDAACDGEQALVGAIMEHLEEAGIHSGDSTCFIPTKISLRTCWENIAEQTKTINGFEN